MIHKGPFVRFTWSFVTDTRLNHHPVAPTGIDQIEWKGRSFNKDADIPFYLRIERQTIYGLPSKKNCYFGIGIHFISALELKKDITTLTQFKSIVHSLSVETLKYKSMFDHKEELLKWLTRNIETFSDTAQSAELQSTSHTESKTQFNTNLKK